MRTPLRLLAALGLVLGLAGVTSPDAGAGTGDSVLSTFDVTVYICSTTDDGLAGETEFLIDVAPDELDCVAETLANGVTVTLYDTDDNVLDSGTTVDGETTLETPVMDSLDFYLGEDLNGDVSDQATIEVGQNPTVTIVIFTDADGELEVTKLDEASAPLSGAGFTLYTEDCQTAVAEEQITNDQGVVLFSDILAGEYCLIESTVPGGYLPLPAPITVEIVGGQTESIDVPNEIAPSPGTVVAVKYVCADDERAGETEFDFLQGTPVEGCPVAGEVEIVLVDAGGATVATEATDGAGVAAFSPVDPGDYRLVEGEAESDLFTVGAGETVSVNVINYVEEEGGQVLVSAFTCTGDQADVVIEVGEPTPEGDFSAAAEDCEPAPFLFVSIFLFGDEESEPITGSTGEDGTILFSDIPPTDDQTGPHLFRVMVFDGDFEAEFEVEDDALTTITVLIVVPPAPTPTVEPTVEPTATTQPTATHTPPAPTATTAPGGATSTAAPTSTVSTLPGTGAGDPIRPNGNAAWLLVGVLGLAGLSTVGYALRRRAA